MFAHGTRVVTLSAHVGTVVATFADGPWAKKFIDCPWCDRSTWDVDIDEADLSESSAPQYLIVTDAGHWRLIDRSRLSLVNAPVGGGFVGYTSKERRDGT